MFSNLRALWVMQREIVCLLHVLIVQQKSFWNAKIMSHLWKPCGYLYKLEDNREVPKSFKLDMKLHFLSLKANICFEEEQKVHKRENHDLKWLLTLTVKFSNINHCKFVMQSTQKAASKWTATNSQKTTSKCFM